MGNFIWAADETTFYILNAHDQDLFTRFQCRTMHSLGWLETLSSHMLGLSFKVRTKPRSSNRAANNRIAASILISWDVGRDGCP